MPHVAYINVSFVGWDGVSVKDLRGLSMGEVRKVLMDVVWREVRGE